MNTEEVPKILVLDDDDLDFQVLERHMSSFRPPKYELLRAETVDDARTIIAQNEIAAALIDHRLADGGSGLDFIEELGGREGEFPSILLTGMGSGTIDEQAILSGAYDYIDKLGVTRDLVDRSIRFAIWAHAYERRLKASVEEAEMHAAMNREILGVVSHEMQSPVGSIIGYCDHLAESCQTDATRNAADRMKAAATHLEDFLRNLSEYVRLDSGAAEICETEFRPDILFEETVQFFEPFAQHKEIELNADFSSVSGAVLLGDSVRVRQIMINLIKNAVKYSDLGVITVSAVYENEVLSVCIKDDGVGMETSQVSAILSGETAWKGAGGGLRSGLGLSICLRLLKLMNGTLILESKPGEGTTAGFEIPLKSVADAAAA